MGFLMTEPSKILLLSMPFGALNRQALGISLLKAALLERGVACDLRYFTFDFAEFIGLEDYQWINFELPYTAFAGDWVFTQALYGTRASQDAAYINDVLFETWQLEPDTVKRFRAVRAKVEGFLEFCLDVMPWQDYKMVGFTSTFEQNIASLALAKRLKAKFPHLSIVFGGANWEATMGLELHKQFEFVDYVCSGEAEESFPALVNVVLEDKLEFLGTIPGIVYHQDQASVSTGFPRLIKNMDSLPMPDYSDYFIQLERSISSTPITPNLLFETSRGCWWGAKSHCTFCGLNGGSLSFRSKSPARALSELEFLSATWGIETLEVVDNILDMHYFETWLPQLAAQPEKRQLFFEIKANLSREQVELLASAGIYRVQPGIESLSDNILKLMRKGTTALRNVQLLKYCFEAGIGVDWNILYGFPGETQTDYDAMLEMLHAIRFLQPPAACGAIRLDRFSPNFDQSLEFGFENVRPMKPYQYLYPFAPEVLHKIAYYFEYDYAKKANHEPAQNHYARGVIAFVDEWKRHPETGRLYGIASQDSLKLIDSRSTATTPSLELRGADRTIYEYCDAMHNLGSILKKLAEAHPEQPFEALSVKTFLESLVAHKLMISDGTNYLALALNAAPTKKQQARALVQTQARAELVTT
jgi:ribosomal peptide maturation radical SAM protein 1